MLNSRGARTDNRLFLWEQWVNDWFDTNVDESLENLEGDTQQRYGR